MIALSIFFIFRYISNPKRKLSTITDQVELKRFSQMRSFLKFGNILKVLQTSSVKTLQLKYYGLETHRLKAVTESHLNVC